MHLRAGFKIIRAACLSLLIVFAALPLAAQERDKVLVMGDSLLAINALTNQNVAQYLRRSLPADVQDNAVIAASVLYPFLITGAAGLSIPKQMRHGAWDWVVMNGGGNDLSLLCGCDACNGILNRLISADGAAGAIPQMVQTARATGAKVIYTGYLRTPGFTSPVEHCAEIGVHFEGRLARMAQRDPGVFFLPLDELVPYGDTSFHSADNLHPSPKGSAAIATKLMEIMRQHGS